MTELSEVLAVMNPRFDQISDCINKISNSVEKTNEHLNSIDKTLLRQELSLEEHIKRTTLLEGRMSDVEKKTNELEDVKKNVGLFVKVLKILLSIGLLGGGGAGVTKLINVFFP
jgi:predicted DNA-binding ArsR family transcriptional regulator